MATSILKKNFPGVEVLQQTADTADYIIGLDLHKKTTAICIIDPEQPDKPVFQRKRLKNELLLIKLQEFDGKKLVACEAAYGWFPLRDALAGMLDVTLVTLNANKTSAWAAASGIKNDKVDAEVLCHACLHGGIPRLAVHQPDRKSRECFKLALYRQQLVRHQTRLKNQIKAIEREYGTNPYTGEIPKRSDLVATMEADCLEALLYVQQRIQSADECIAVLSKNDGICNLLQAIPGIGPVTSFALRHKIETINRFEDAAHLNAYFGLSLREHSSGNYRIKGKITKTGNTFIRTLLIQGAQVARFRCPEYLALSFPCLSQEDKMKNRKHANKVVVALARKSLSQVYRTWKSGEEFSLDAYRQSRRQQCVSSTKTADLDMPLVRLGHCEA